MTLCAAGWLPAAEPSPPSPPLVAETEAIAGIKRLGGRFLAKGCRPSWSPDGSRLVFAENSGLKILDVDSGKIGDLAAPGEDPAWSFGDGRHIAYVRRSGAGKETDKQIWLVDAAGGPSRKLVAGSAPAWSADGKTLFWYSPATSKIQSMPTDSEDAPVTDLLSVKLGASCPHPAVSPDGKRIAYRSGSQLAVVARDTGETIRTWPLAGVGCYANWSPDGKLLAFGGQGIDDRMGLWILDVAKNQAVRVAGEQFTMPAWSADGAKLACTLRLRAGSEIWMVATKHLAALPPLAPAMDRCSAPEAAAELVGPRHQPQGKLVCLDLRQHANQKLTEKFNTADNDLKELPQGEQTFAGVKFRIADSAIQLASSRLPDAPRAAEGIPVQARMNRLYILHSTQWGDAHFGVRDGTTIGRYEIRYADGCRVTIPIVCGEDVRDWWSLTRGGALARGQVAWVGRNAAVKKSNNRYLRLYLTAWENPHPEKIVASLDYVSTMTAAAPFCVAMTAEEPR